MININRMELVSAINMIRDVADYGHPRGTPKTGTVWMEMRGGQLWLHARGVQVAVPIDTTGQIIPLPDGHADYNLEWLWEMTHIQHRIVTLTYTAGVMADEEPGEVLATASAAELRAAIDQTATAAQPEPSALGLNNVAINFEPVGIVLTAGNRYRMSSASVMGSECTGQQWETVAPVDLRRLGRMLLRLPAATVVTIARRNNALSFVTAIATYTMPLAERVYPDYRSLFDRQVPPTVHVAVKEAVNMELVLRNVRAHSGRKKAEDYLTLSVRLGELFSMAGFLTVSLDGQQVGELPVQISGEATTCDVNASCLTHAIKTCSGPMVIDIWTNYMQMLRVSSAGCRHIIMLRARP